MRRLLCVLAVVAVGQTAALLIKARAPRSAAWSSDAGDVVYGQEVQRSSLTAISAPTASIAPIANSVTPIPHPIVSVDPAKTIQSSLPRRRHEDAETANPSLAVSTASQGRTEPSFWDLLSQAQNDPDREILDRTYAANGLSIHLEEFTKTGILHFELENTSTRIAYLPKIAVPGSKARAYFERQVLEAETSQQGLLVFGDPQPSGSIDAVVSAANVAPFKVRIETPDWRK